LAGVDGIETPLGIGRSEGKRIWEGMKIDKHID
jgi:hypothetical protein